MSQINGALPLPFGKGVYRVVLGGPYKSRPPGTYGVKLAPEVPGQCDVFIPTPDFGLPDPKDVNYGLLKVLPRIYDGELVYVGCMGGIGRTGLFMACLTKAALSIARVKIEPIAYVRNYYLSRAVETAAQEAFVRDFDVKPVVAAFSRYV